MRDAVDEITDAWQEQRPDLDVAAIGVTTRVRRLAKILDSLRSEVLARHGLQPATLDLLATLRRSGPPFRLPVLEVRRRTLVSAGAVSMRVDRAEAAGWVTRLPHATDARQVEVQLTTKGRRLVDRAFEGIVASEQALLADLSAHQRHELDDLVRIWLATAMRRRGR